MSAATSENTTTNRNPLHPEALKMNELTPGLKIQQFRHGSLFMKPANIVGRPFRYRIGKRESWRIKLQTTDHRDRLVIREVFLDDLGITPYGCDDSEHWNPIHYTLAV